MSSSRSTLKPPPERASSNLSAIQEQSYANQNLLFSMQTQISPRTRVEQQSNKETKLPEKHSRRSIGVHVPPRLSDKLLYAQPLHLCDFASLLSIPSARFRIRPSGTRSRPLGVCATLLAAFLVSSSVLAADKFAAVPEKLQSFVTSGEISGAVSLVASRDGVLHLSAVGQSDLASGRKMETNDLFLCLDA